MACAQVNGEAADNFRRMAEPRDSKDRRSDVRIDVSFPINLEVEKSGKRTPAVVENVSLGGVLLRTDAALALDESVILEIHAADSPALRLPATVVRFTGSQSYGTAFVSLSEADADRLMDLTAAFLKSATPAPWFLG